MTTMVSLKNFRLLTAIALMTWFGTFASARAEGIHDAVNNGDLALVTTILQASPDLANSRDEEGMSPLHYAALDGRPELISVLIDNHADVNATDNSGQTPLHMAVVFRNGGAVDQLLASGANVNTTDSNGQTALHVAAVNGFTEIAGTLIGHGATVDVRDNGGQTPLHKAATFGQRKFVKLLLTLNADVNALDETNVTPLAMARMNNFHEVADLLKENGGTEMLVASDSQLR